MGEISIYQKIENDIKQKITDGNLNHGDKIDSENELKKMYTVSRSTVRHALNNLVNEGYLYRHKGKGTFVNSGKIKKKMQGLLSFTEEMKKMNKKVYNKIITFHLEKANEEVSKKLFLNAGEEVYMVERIRHGNGIPVLFEKMYIPKHNFENLNKEIMESSFYEYVEKTLNNKISYCVQTLEAINSDSRVSEFLKISEDTSVIYMTRSTFLDKGFPFEYVEAYYRSDQYVFIQHSVR